MALFKKQGVYWIDYYVSVRRKRERIGPDKRLAETVLTKRQVAIIPWVTLKGVGAHLAMPEIKEYTSRDAWWRRGLGESGIG